MADMGPPNEREHLLAQVKIQGDMVRKLKEEKAPREQVSWIAAYIFRDLSSSSLQAGAHTVLLRKKVSGYVEGLFFV